MKTNYSYTTVSQAIEQLKKQGFTLDFNLEKNCIVCESGKFTAEEFEVLEVFRYEGDSDPADEATVYGIQSSTGLKGILVTGYGASAEDVSFSLLGKLKINKE